MKNKRVDNKFLNKKAQFYLVAAIIIVLIISGIVSVKTYAMIKAKPRAVQDLSSELKEESLRIVDYGVYQEQDKEELLHNFTDTEFAPYFLKKTANSNVVFVYGNKTDLFAVKYNTVSTGGISASIGSAVTTWTTATTFADRVTVTPTDPIEVNILNKTFTFKLGDNEVFYFVIVQEREGELYVDRN
jgi:hypothetical protein